LKTKRRLTKETSQKVACGMPACTQVQAGLTEDEYIACIKVSNANDAPGFDCLI
jgi:hypothetical protein